MNFTSTSGAIFNKHKTERYVLWRRWDDSLPNLLFIGLNPSKADGTYDDPTTKRIINHSKRLGYGGCFLLNCFTQIATQPKALRASGKWSKNVTYLNEVIPLCSEVIFAWGKHHLVKELARDIYFQKRFPNAKCFGNNCDGSPKHPLYLSYAAALQPFR